MTVRTGSSQNNPSHKAQDASKRPGIRAVLYPIVILGIILLAAARPNADTPVLPDLKNWLLTSLQAAPTPIKSAAFIDAILRDTIETYTLEADTLDLINTPRSKRYFAPLGNDYYFSSVRPRYKRSFFLALPQTWRHEVVYDSLTSQYISRESIGNMEIRLPTSVNLDTYRSIRMSESVESTWYTLIDQRNQQRARERRGGLGFNIVVPGGRQSAFTTIFGKPEVDLRVNGQADIRAGFDYRKSELQTALGRPSQLDPQFKQDLRLGIGG